MVGIGSVFSEETNAAMHRMRCLVEALRAPRLAPHDQPDVELFDPKACTLLVSTDAVRMAGALNDVALECNTCLQTIHATMEEHFVRFFDHLKKRSDDELALWIPKSGHVTSDQAAVMRSGPTTHAKTRPNNAALAAAVDALNAWMHVELEATLTTTHATCGAVYLRSADASGYLRPACVLPADAKLPRDVALASGSTIGTVVLSGVGVNITKSRGEDGDKSARDESADTARAAGATSAVPLDVRNAIVLPIMSVGDACVGCVVVANKREMGAAEFDTSDELRVWSLAAAAEGVFQRYQHGQLLQHSVSRPEYINALKHMSHISAAHEATAVDPITAHGVTIPTRSKRMLIVRQGTGMQCMAAKEGSTGKELNDEAVIETVAPYIRNLELLWRKSLDNITLLRNECARWEERVAAKEGQIVDLEVALKNLSKQLHRTKADIRRIKHAVPQHLRDTFDSVAGPDETANVRQELLSGQNSTALVALDHSPTSPRAGASKQASSQRGASTVLSGSMRGNSNGRSSRDRPAQLPKLQVPPSPRMGNSQLQATPLSRTAR